MNIECRFFATIISLLEVARNVRIVSFARNTCQDDRRQRGIVKNVTNSFVTKEVKMIALCYFTNIMWQTLTLQKKEKVNQA